MASVARTPEATARPQFFVSQKRNEISELKALFRALPAESANKPESTEKRREILKRLIAYMSMGIDVSSLFSDVVLASATPDIVQKRLVSIYLNNYAESNPDTAILVINAYQKDLLNADPKIRGLALKALSSLGVDSVEEYASEAVAQGLSDTSSYTRTLAVIGVNKLVYRSSAAAALVARLEEFIENSSHTSTHNQVDLQVLIATLIVLVDVKGDAFSVNKTTIVHLFNRLPQASRFQKTVILHILKTYIPQSDDELVGLLQTIEIYLSSATPSVVSSTLICMLALVKQRYTAKGESSAWKTSPLAISVIKRVAPSLITLSANFPILKLVYQLCTFEAIYCDIIREHWVWLVPKYGDSETIKVLKFRILSLFEEPMILDSVAAVVVLPVESRAVLDAVVELFRCSFFRSCVHVRQSCEHEEISETADNCELILQMLLKWFAFEIPAVCSAILPLLADIFRVHAQLQPYCHSVFGTIEDYIGDLDAQSCEALLSICAMQPLNVDVKGICRFLFEKIRQQPDCPKGTKLLSPLLQTMVRVLLVFPSAISDLLYDVLDYINARMSDLPIEVTERYLMISRLIGREPEILRSVYGASANELVGCFDDPAKHFSTTKFDELDKLWNPAATLPFGPAYAEFVELNVKDAETARRTADLSTTKKSLSLWGGAEDDSVSLQAPIGESLIDQSFLTEAPTAPHEIKIDEELLL